MDTIIGQTVDNYKIIDVIGRGGMGVVFKALDLNLDKMVALKMIDPFLARDENFLKRFKSEAKALAKLEDRNIVNVYALRETEYGLFMIMELVKAKTISEWLHEKEKFTVSDTIAITKQILHAINCAHKAGIIHRDIKPNNILLDGDGNVKVMDFGLAKIIQEQGSQVTVTQVAAGTLYYMSPEQIKGLQNVDQRSDIYSIGMTVYEMLAGRTPFEKSDSEFEIQRQIVEGRIVPPLKYNPGIPKQLVKFIMKAIDKDPDKRFQSIPEMQSALSLIEPGNESAEDKTRVITHTTENKNKRIVKPNMYRLIILFSGLILIVIIMAFFFLNKKEVREIKPIAVIDHPQKADIKADINLLGRLSIISVPAGASVTIDGKPFGITPLKLDSLQTGNISVILKKSGYEQWANLNFEVKPGDNLIDSKLIPRNKKESLVKEKPAKESNTAANASLVLKMDLPGKFFIDDNESASDVSIYDNKNLTSGKHTIKFVNPKFGSKQVTINLKENQKKEIICYFMQKISIQSLNTAGDAFWGTIYINGENTGKTTPGDILLSPGNYRITVKKTGYTTVEKDIVLNIEPVFELHDQSFVFHFK